MPLDEYRRKRDFERTPEPSGGAPAEAGSASRARFVVHKHAARQLHYDVRLEIGGVYASWAVPKGPSFDRAEKRLAVHVEDHPLAYGEFEGVIPKGEYGGGTVMIWDRGTFTPLGDAEAMLAEGQLKVVFDGSKLHGAFALVRMKPRPGFPGDNWLLIKERDEFERPHAEYDVTAEETLSAATGRTLDEIAAEGVAWTGAGAAAAPPSAPAAALSLRPDEAPFQLATLAPAVPEGDEWLHDVKYDGYRLRVVVSAGDARAYSRNGLDWSERFPAVLRAVAALPASDLVVDGEAVTFDAEGRSDFGLLQGALSTGAHADVRFVAFDLLAMGGHDLRAEPLTRRREVLAELLRDVPDGSPLLLSESQRGEGGAFLSAACARGLEGVVSKRADRPWMPGRGRDWVKVKCARGQEFVVGGFTDPSGSRSGFGALVLGVYADGALVPVGRVGTGFDDRTLRSLRARLDAIAADASPFATAPAEAEHIHWVRPELVVDVTFREWTREGVLRQPVFRGVREDVDPLGVRREEPEGARETGAHEADDPPRPLVVAGITITNAEKVLHPAGVTKADLAVYLDAVAPLMLTHVANRFLMAVRCPSGKGGETECFHQKHPGARGWPASLPTITVAEKDGVQEDFYVTDVAGLVALAQLGVGEIHAWNSLVGDFDTPDRIVFDLDPAEDVSFERVVAAADMVRGALETLGLVAFVKTTGGRGLHVVTSIVPAAGYTAVRSAARSLCEWLARSAPETFTARMAKAARPGHVYLDYLRNAHGATAVAAYSPRARPGGAVSTPVTWEELRAGLDPTDFTLATVRARVAAGTDPWSGYEAGRRALDLESFGMLA